MALHTDTEIYKATYDLTKLVTELVANMPRSFKADFGAELRKRCMGLVMRTYEANTSELEHRVQIIRRMRGEVEAVNLSLRLAVDHKLISRGQYARAIALTASVAKQATGWQKHSESALVAEPSRRPGQRAMESGRTAGPQAHRKAQQEYRRRTLRQALNRLEYMPDEDVYASGNSYLGLARQASHSHHEQALICRALLKRGHAVDGLHFNKAFRRRSIGSDAATGPHQRALSFLEIDMDYLHPIMVEALRGHMPPAKPAAPAEPTEEADLLAADLCNMQHKERLHQERALALQIRYGSGQ